MKIRYFKMDEDFEEVSTWARKEFGSAPTEDQLSCKTTFLVETDKGEKAAVVSLLLTNSKYYAMPECLFLNPELPTKVLREALERLSLYVTAFAKALEYKKLIILSPNETLTRRYKKLGFSPTLSGVTTMVKAL